MHWNITKATTVKIWVWVLRYTTPLTHINFFLIFCGGGLPSAGTQVTPSLIMLAVSWTPAESFLFFHAKSVAGTFFLGSRLLGESIEPLPLSSSLTSREGKETLNTPLWRLSWWNIAHTCNPCWSCWHHNSSSQLLLFCPFSFVWIWALGFMYNLLRNSCCSRNW